jgi:hypothetical protein
MCELLRSDTDATRDHIDRVQFAKFFMWKKRDAMVPIKGSSISDF